MAVFEYQALDSAGRRQRGVVSADSLRLARRELRRRKLLPVKLEQTTARAGADAAPRFGGRIGPRDLTLVTRQLATLIKADSPVEEAVQSIALQAEKPAVRKILLAVRSSVTEGQGLSQALAVHERSFSPLYRSMVAAGEASGTLGPVLERLADHLEKSQKLRSKIFGALAYPVFLALVALTVVGVLMTFIVPKMVEQFDTLGRELPLLTQVLIAVSDGMRTLALPALAGVLLGGLVLMRLLRRESVRRRVDHGLLALPVAGRLMRGLHAARLARTLSTLISSGTPVLEGLSSAQATVRNVALRDALREVTAQVREGAGLSAALRKSGAFPPLVVYMTAMGEKSGTLDAMLSKSADYLEDEFETFTTAALNLLGPAIILIMGGIVTLIVLAILLPILQFNSMAML